MEVLLISQSLYGKNAQIFENFFVLLLLLLLLLFIQCFWLYFSEIFTHVGGLQKTTFLKISGKSRPKWGLWRRFSRFSTLALYITAIQR